MQIKFATSGKNKRLFLQRYVYPKIFEKIFGMLKIILQEARVYYLLYSKSFSLTSQETA